MPAEYKIFQNPDLVFIRFFGHVDIDEITDALSEFGQDSRFRFGMPHYFDLSQLVSFERNMPKIMAWMAMVAGVYPADGSEQLMVFHAPPGPAFDLMVQIRKSWDGGPKHPVVMRVLQGQDDALQVLGITHPSLSSLLNRPA